MSSMGITSSSQQSKEPSLLRSLRQFEVSIVSRFLNAQQKLLTISILSKAWHSLISKHYSWSKLPELGPGCLVSGFVLFFDHFSELTGIEVPHFPGQFISQERIAKLQTARSVSISKVMRLDHFFQVVQSPKLLRVLRELSTQLIDMFPPQKTLEFFETISSPEFCEAMSGISKLGLYFYSFETKNPVLQDREFTVSLKPLQRLRDLEFKVTAAGHKSSPFQVRLIDLPASLESLTLDKTAKTFTDNDLSSLQRLNTLKVDSLTKQQASQVTAVEHLKVSCSLPYAASVQLKNLLSLNIKVSKYGSSIVSDLPLLTELVVSEIVFKITLQNLPSLRMLQINRQKMQLQNGVSTPVSIDKKNNKQLELKGAQYLRYELQYDKTNYSLLSDCFFQSIEGINQVIDHNTPEAILPENCLLPSFQCIEVRNELPILNFTTPSVNDLFLRLSVPDPKLPISLRLVTETLSLVILDFSQTDLNVVFNKNLRALRVYCRELLLRGKGSVRSLHLSLKALKQSEQSWNTLKTVRNLSFQNWLLKGQGPNSEHLIPWDSLLRLTLNHFHEKGLNSIIKEAPRLQEVELSGQLFTQESEDSARLKICTRTIKLLNTKRLYRVREIHLDKNRSPQLILLLKEKTKITSD